MRFSAAFLATVAATLVAAHPGADVHAEAAQIRRFALNSKRNDLGHCADKLKARGHDQLAIERRKNIAQKHAKRGLIERAASDINVSHLSSADFTADTSLDDVLAANSSCVLSPEETEGPYYVGGEYIRSNVTEGQAGVPLLVDIQLVDMDTCEPIEDKWVEIWHCNSTGVYSGVESGGDYTSAPENLNTTFLRGLQKSGSDGAVQFQTLFPGHYSGRTQHIHVLLHTNATERANGTILDTNATHVGQMYFDQDLSDAVETYSPYNTNTQALTTNEEDSLLLAALETSDPIMEYVLLGEDVSDGVLAWLSFGVNTSYTYSANAAAIYYADGGESTGSSGGAGGLGGSGGFGSGGLGSGGLGLGGL